MTAVARPSRSFRRQGAVLVSGRLRARRRMPAKPEADWREIQRPDWELIPNLVDQNPCAQSRRPMDMIVQGWSTGLFHAWEQ